MLTNLLQRLVFSFLVDKIPIYQLNFSKRLPSDPQQVGVNIVYLLLYVWVDSSCRTSSDLAIYIQLVSRSSRDGQQFAPDITIHFKCISVGNFASL